METGSAILLITAENVHKCLDELVEISPQRVPNPLHFLLLVDLYLTVNPHLPPTPQRRYNALSHLLASFITERYRHHRITLNLAPINGEDLYQQQALYYIAEEGLLASIELLSWSWLYYHFVRVDLDIAYSTFCNNAHIDKRTLRRYQQHGIQRLTDYLSEREGEARKEQRKRWMYTQLPGSVFAPFVARDNLLEQTVSMLRAASPSHILISGSPCIGKTTLAGMIAKSLIDGGTIDRLVWINRPQSVEFVRRHLSEQLLSERSSLSLREYALIQRLLIVVDDIESIYHDKDNLENLLDEVRPALVLMTSRVYTAISQSIHVPMSELSKEGIYAVLNSISRNGVDAIPEDRAAHIWEHSGGNPAAAIVMLQHWPFDAVLSLSVIYDSLLYSYTVLEFSLKKAWLSFVLLSPAGYDLKSIKHFWQDEIGESQLQYLIRHHLLEISEDEDEIKYYLPTLGRRFIEDDYSSNAEMHQIIDDLIYQIDATHPQDQGLLLEAVEYILLAHWLEMDVNIRERWIGRFCEDGLHVGHAATWSAILESYAESNEPHLLRFRINYGVCLRRLSQWKQADELFDQTSQSAGRMGLFIEQAYALLEWAIVFHHRGNYNKALELLAHVESVLPRYEDRQLSYRLRLEQIQIALDTGDIGRAEGIIRELPETLRTLTLWCEIFLLKRDHRSLHRLYQKIESTLMSKPRDYARIQIVLGQSYHESLNLVKAYQYFYAALALVEEDRDIFAAARIRSNLAGVMIEQGAYRDARLTLEYAENMQKQLKDRVGLAVTRHNIQLLKRKVVG